MLSTTQGERRSAGEEDGCSTTTQSTIPSLPSLEGSQYLTGREPMLDQRHHKRVARSERCLWDSDVPAVLGRSDEERGYWHGNLSDTAVYVQRQVHDGRRKIKKGTNLVNEEPALPQLSCSAPSPTLSRLVQQKTEGMKLSDAVLEEIKEMSGHLRIVNWLWDSQCVVPHPPNPAPATSGNLVVVRRNSHNWFDQPQLKDIREVLSPISLNSELMSDFEDELTGLI